MSMFKRVICYCLIFNIFFNNILTSFVNTAWASHTIQDLEHDDQRLTQIRKIPAKQAVIEQDITERWQEKYTLSGFSIFRIIGLVLAIGIGLLALNAWEPINAKTLFPAIGIPKLGNGTETAFYEATAATHWMLFTGAVPYSYSIFKFGLKTADVLINTAKKGAFRIKTCCTKQQSHSLEEGALKEDDQEKLNKSKYTTFRKTSIGKFLGYILPEAISLGAGFTYALIMVSYLYKIENPHFPKFFNFSAPFLLVSIMSDKAMSGHTKIREIFEWFEKKINRNEAEHVHSLKSPLEKAIKDLQNLDLEDPKDRKTLYALAKKILPKDESILYFEKEFPPINDEHFETANLLLPSKQKATTSLASGQMASSSQGRTDILDVNLDEEDLVKAFASPISFEDLYESIREFDNSHQKDTLSKILHGLSYGISLFGTWGLATVMTQNLETILGNPTLATFLGLSAAGWTTFIEPEDIYKSLKELIAPYISQLFTKKTNSENITSCTPGSSKYISSFLTRAFLYKALLLSTAWAYTFVEFTEYLDQNEPYDNVFSKVNNTNPTLKYAGLSTFYLFELLSHMHFQDRAYKALWRRGKQPTKWSITSLSSLQERLIGVFEVMMKEIDHLNEEGLSKLEPLIPLNQEIIDQNHHLGSTPTTLQWFKVCCLKPENKDETTPLLNE